MPIDFSKINLSVLPKGGNVVKAPPKKGRIDYGAIKLSNIYTPSAVKTTLRPVATPKVPAAAVPSTPFIGRPLITPFEQQRMKVAATPIPETKMTALSATSVRAPKFGEVPAAKFNEWFMSPGPNVPKNSKGQPVVPVRNLPFGDENPHLDWERMTDAGGNKVLLAPWNDPVVKNDTINKMYYSAGGILTGMVVFLATIVASSLGTRQAVKDLRTQEQKLGQAAEQGISEYQPMVDIKAAATTAAESQRNANQQLGFLSRNEYGAIQQFSDGEIRGLVTRAGWDMTDGEINSMISGLRASATMPKLPTVSTDAINSFVSSTLRDSGTKIGNMTQLLLAIGDALPSPPPALANILAPLLAMQHPTQAAADSAEKDATTFFQGLQSEISTDSWSRLAVPVGQPVTTSQVSAPAPTRFAIPAQTATRPVAPAIPMGGGTQPALSNPAVVSQPKVNPTTLKVPTAPVGAPAVVTRPVSAFTTPAAIDKTIPAIDIKKANLVDVTAKVDLQSVQVKFPSADTVVLDTKRRVVMFMHGTTPLEAVGVDKPQLNEWYGIDGAKLLGEITQPVVAQIAPTLSKMETPAPAELQPLVAEAKKYGSVAQFVGAIEHAKYLTTPGLMVGQKNLPVGGELIDTVLDKKGGAWYRVKTMGGTVAVIPVEQAKVITGWRGDLIDFYDRFVGNAPSPTPVLSTTPQIGTATTISNQKTGISTSTPVTPRVGAQTGSGEVKWGKWIDAVGSRKTDGVGTGQVDTIKTPVTYRLGSGEVEFRKANGMKQGEWLAQKGKLLQLKDDPHTYYLSQVQHDNPNYKDFVVTEGRSGALIGRGSSAKDAIGNAQETLLTHKGELDSTIEGLVASHGEVANPAPTSIGTPASVPAAPISSTSAPAAAPSLGNATPAHGLIDYSKIELNGTTSQTSPKVLASVGNTGKRSRVETKGFDNYVQNTTGTKDTSLSPMSKFKEGRDLQVRRYENQFDGLMKTPAGAEWMTMAIEADEILREEYARPFAINEAGERVYVEGEFAPAILNRYLKQYGPNFGKFLQHLQRAGISTETTLGLSAEKEALKQKHIFDARMSLVNFQKNEPQLFTAYMAAADELGNANALLAEFYKGMISPETYANDKANPHYYVSLSAGKTDVFDRSGVAPLERTHGLTDLDNVIPPLEGLKAVYVDAIRAQGINNAKKEAVRSNKNSEVATTELSDSIVHLKENGVDKAYDVRDTNVTKSVQNLTLKKPDVPTWEKYLVRSPTTLLRLFATGLNPAFGLYNIMRDTLQGVGTLPLTPKGLVKGAVRAFKSPGLSQWFDSYRDPMMSKGTRALEALKAVTSIITYPNEIGESLTRSVVAESILDRGGTYLDQLHGYFASTGFFALHGTFFNDFIASNIPFTRATIAVVRSAYRNTFFGLPIGDKGGTFSGKQGAEKLAGRNLATIIFTIVSALAVKEAGKEKEYKLLRDRASYFYFPTPSGAWIKLPVPIGFQPIKAVTDSLFGYKSDPMDVARQTLNVLPGLESFMLPPALALFLQLKFNINFFTGAAIDAAVGTPAANPLEAGIMKATGWTEERTAFVVRAFLADIPSQVQYVFDMVGQGSSTQAFPASKRFIVKDPTTSSNAAVDDFYALVDAASRSSNAALKHYVNARADAIGKLLHNAKLYPADARVYMTTATDNIIATFATIAENPSDYGIKKFGPFSWRPKGNYEELAP